MDSLVASQVAARLPRERFGHYAGIASVAAGLTAANREEADDWAELYGIVGPGCRIGDAEQAQVRSALGRAVLAAKRQRLLSGMLTKAVGRSGLLTRGEIMGSRNEVARAYASEAGGYMICKPLAATPPADHYGQAPSPVDLTAPFKP